jgi:uncharacterized protein YbaP (TraB family)
MQQQLHKIGFTIFLCCVAGLAQAQGSLPPRLWKVSAPPVDGRSGPVLYLLGITHFGLPGEYDAYLERRVLPALRSAQTLSFEGAGGREDEQRPACDPSVLDEQGRSIVAQARERAAALAIQAREVIHASQLKAGIDDGTTKEQRERFWRTYIAELDEFDLIAQATIDMSILASAKPQPGRRSSPWLARGPVINRLLQEHPAVQVQDVDSKYGARRAYCSAGPARVKFLISQLERKQMGSPAVTARIPQYQREAAMLLSGRPLPAHGLMSQIRELDNTFVCGRNREWLREMVALDDGNVHFYALGIRHLFPVHRPGANCGGLLADLAARGLRVERVE